MRQFSTKSAQTSEKWPERKQTKQKMQETRKKHCNNR